MKRRRLHQSIVTDRKSGYPARRRVHSFVDSSFIDNIALEGSITPRVMGLGQYLLDLSHQSGLAIAS
jgi:hypothetical protein